jgi:hypothetical protein
MADAALVSECEPVVPSCLELDHLSTWKWGYLMQLLAFYLYVNCVTRSTCLQANFAHVNPSQAFARIPVYDLVAGGNVDLECLADAVLIA